MRAVKTVKGVEWLKSLGLFCTAKRGLEGDFTMAYSLLTNGIVGAGTNLFSLVTSDKTQGIDMKLQKRRLRMDYKAKVLY